MKITVIILLFFATVANGQRNRIDPYSQVSLFDHFKVEDSKEGLYIADTLLKIIHDTLPLYVRSEDKIDWRDIRIVSYYYDSLKCLKKTAFRDGRKGNYYFYFEGLNLIKARYLYWTPSINSKFYYSDEDNRLSSDELDRKLEEVTDKKQFYEVLRLGKDLSSKFKTLL